MVFRKEVGAAVNEAVGPVQAGLEAEVRDLRRVLQDDMDASNEATEVFGRLLAQLRDRLDDIDARLASMSTRLDRIEQPSAPSKRASSSSGGRSRAGKQAPAGAPDPAA